MSGRPRIGITLGDPSGIGPEIVSRTLREAPVELRARVIVFGDRGVLDRAGGVPADVSLEEVTSLSPDRSRPGEPHPDGGVAQVRYLEAAAAAARGGRLDALVTAPLSKRMVKAAGFPFPGHTEFLASSFGEGGRPLEHAMMFAGPRLRVVLATIHVPLAEVPRRLSPEGIAAAIRLGGEALARDFGVASPRIGVVGLNPHAGEGGLFGDEERTIVGPGIEAGRARLHGVGVAAEVAGPLVPDVAFRLAVEGRFDLLVAMYHDQGLIPVKLVDFEEAVNVTLGLPIVRTSPDHGVAYDIAGRGLARATSFAAALSLADAMARSRLGML